MTTAAATEVLRRRRTWRRQLLREARDFVGRIDPALGLRSAVVVGSVARGDFHIDSDIDLVITAERLPARAADRLAAVGWPDGGRVVPVVWTPEELARQRRRRNPLAVEADTVGLAIWPTPGKESEAPSIG